VRKEVAFHRIVHFAHATMAGEVEDQLVVLLRLRYQLTVGIEHALAGGILVEQDDHGVDARSRCGRAQPADEGHGVHGGVAELRDAAVLIVVHADDEGAALADDPLLRVALRNHAAAALLCVGGERAQGERGDNDGQQDANRSHVRYGRVGARHYNVWGTVWRCNQERSVQSVA
jgi:hypothetical protein